MKTKNIKKVFIVSIFALAAVLGVASMFVKGFYDYHSKKSEEKQENIVTPEDTTEHYIIDEHDDMWPEVDTNLLNQAKKGVQ